MKKKSKLFKVELSGPAYQAVATEINHASWREAYEYCSINEWHLIIDGQWFEMWIVEE